MSQLSREAIFDREGFFQEREESAAWVSTFIPQYIITRVAETGRPPQWQATFSDGAQLSLLQVFKAPSRLELYQVAIYLRKVGSGGTYIAKILNSHNQTQTYAMIDSGNFEETWVRLNLATDAGYYRRVERGAIFYLLVENQSRIDSNNQLLFGYGGKPGASYFGAGNREWRRMAGELATQIYSLPESKGLLGTFSSSYILGEYIVPQYSKGLDPVLFSTMTKSANWLMTMQNSTPTSRRYLLFHDGQDIYFGRKVSRSHVLAVTQAIIALARTYEVTKEKKYLNASIMAIGAFQRCFLNHTTGAVYMNMIEDETFEVYGNQSKRIVEPYGGRALTAMILMYRLTGNHSYLQQAMLIADFFTRAQNHDGSWYAIMDDEGRANTWFGSEPYVSSYALEGLFDVYSATRIEAYHQAFLKGCRWLASNAHVRKGAPDHVILSTGQMSNQLHSLGSLRVVYLCYLMDRWLKDSVMKNIGNIMVKHLSKIRIRINIFEYSNQTVTMTGRSFIVNNWSIHYDSLSDQPDNTFYPWFELIPLVLSIKVAWIFESLESPPYQSASKLTYAVTLDDAGDWEGSIRRVPYRLAFFVYVTGAYRRTPLSSANVASSVPSTLSTQLHGQMCKKIRIDDQC